MRSDKHRGNSSVDSWLNSHKEEITDFQNTYHFSDVKEEDMDELEEVENTEYEGAPEAKQEPEPEIKAESTPKEPSVSESELAPEEAAKESEAIKEEPSIFKHVVIPDHEEIHRMKAEKNAEVAEACEGANAADAYEGTTPTEEKLSRRERRRQEKLEKLAERELEKGQVGFSSFDGEEGAVPTRSRKKAVWMSIISILIILGCVGGCAFYLMHHMTAKMNVASVDVKEFDIDPTVEKDLKNYTNIAILGVDARKDESSENSRSDAIIVMTVDNETKDIQVTSVMRDSYLKIEDADGNEKIDKVTHAHAFGGPVDTCRALNRNLDLNISQYLVFNWQAVADTVDALGGVTVDVQANEIADLNKYGQESAENVGGTYTPIYETGKQTLNGAQAVTYCRIRKTSGGDTGRGNRFKKVMTALIKSASKMNASKLQKIANQVLPEITTNMKTQTMLGMALNVKEFNITKSRTWPESYQGGLIGGVWYAVPVTLESNTQWLHEKVFDQKDYQLTDRSKAISDEIISASGYSEPKTASDKNDEKEADDASNTN